MPEPPRQPWGDEERAARENRFLEHELLAAEEELVALRQKLRLARHKQHEVDHYRSLLHRLRSRWYLRPFLPARLLGPPQASDPWKYRGPRFALPREVAGPRGRVLVVGHLLSSRLFGSEQSLLDTIDAIDPERFDTLVVFPEENEAVFEKLKPHVQGIGVLDYRWWKTGRGAHDSSIAAFEAILREQAIDLVHVNTIMIREPLLAAQRQGVPSIVHARELISRDPQLAGRLGATPATIVREVCSSATHVLANSATTLAEYQCGSRGSFLYNCIDDRALDLPNLVDPHSLKVGLISSNIRKKGVLEFFELAARAADALPALHFYLIGPRTPLIEGWRAGLDRLPVNVQLRDYVSPPAEAYREVNLVLNLSRFAESFGRTAAEAMMARRPVIAYRHGAMAEIIEDGETGFLVEYQDLNAVLERLAFFAANPEKIAELGESARQRCKERFSCENFRRGINSLYGRLIREAPPAR